jgi:hypothetical protein
MSPILPDVGYARYTRDGALAPGETQTLDSWNVVAIHVAATALPKGECLIVDKITKLARTAEKGR